MAEGDGFRETREEMERAIRKLSALENFFFIGALVLAVGGGWVVAYLLSRNSSLPLRPTWAVLSILLLVIPAAAVMVKNRARGLVDRQSSNDERNGN